MAHTLIPYLLRQEYPLEEDLPGWPDPDPYLHAQWLYAQEIATWPYRSVRARPPITRLRRRTNARAYNIDGGGRGRKGIVIATSELGHIVVEPTAAATEWASVWTAWLSGADDEAPPTIPPIYVSRLPGDSWGMAPTAPGDGVAVTPTGERRAHGHSADILHGARLAGAPYVLAFDVPARRRPDGAGGFINDTGVEITPDGAGVLTVFELGD